MKENDLRQKRVALNSRSRERVSDMGLYGGYNNNAPRTGKNHEGTNQLNDQSASIRPLNSSGNQPSKEILIQMNTDPS